MASDILKEIADNLGVGLVNGSYLNGIANYYGVNLATSTDLMRDILTEVGGNPATSTDYLQDIVLELGQDTTVNANWMEAWLLATTGPVFSDDRITENGDSRFTEDALNERVTQ
jgi:hypothetical protein